MSTPGVPDDHRAGMGRDPHGPGFAAPTGGRPSSTPPSSTPPGFAPPGAVPPGSAPGHGHAAPYAGPGAPRHSGPGGPGVVPGQQAFPTGPPPSVSADQFRPPKDNKPIWIVAIVVAVVVLVVAAASIVAWRNDVAQQQRPATPAPTLPSGGGSQSGNGIDFVSPDGSGRLEIVEKRWESDGVLVRVRLSVTDGEAQYGLYNFQAFDEAGTLYQSSIQEVPDPPLGEGYLQEGQTTEGWIRFQISRQDVTVLMLSEYGKAITAYKIAG